MKLLFVFCLIALSACSSLMNAKGTVQPVVMIDAKQKIMFTTCSGTVEDWGTCNSKARNACADRYEVLKKEENPTGARRELTFQCK